MESDTEMPTAPPAWTESIHGDLVVVDRMRVDTWEQLDRGHTDPNEQVVVERLLATTDRGAGVSFRIPTPPALALSTLVAHGDDAYVLTDLSGAGDDALRDAVGEVPDDAFSETDATIEAGFLGFVMFDGAASWEMVSESMLYVVLEVPSGTYRASVAETELRGTPVRLVRLRR